MSNLAAVLTGDLIGSTAADPARVDRTMAMLEQHAGLISKNANADFRFTRFRGDGWQILQHDPCRFLWTAIYLNAVLKADPDNSIPTRIAIGLGRVDQLGATDLSAAKGSAFVHSGRALDAMTNSGHTLALAGEETNDIQRSLLAFVDDRIQSWSREQADVMRLKLTPGKVPTHEEIAAILRISRQAVGARLQAAGFALINDAVLAFQHHFTPKVA